MAPSMDRLGIWGKPTSTLDWCEENYAVTPYIAEFWNTVSNVIMILPPSICAVYYWKKGIEQRYLMAILSLLAVGIGSWMFHMTLWYEMQLLDELPMIYGTCVFLFALRHHAKPPKYHSITYISSLVLCSIVVTVVYLQWQNPIFHQVCYALLVFGLLYEAVLAMNNYPEIRPTVFTSLLLYVFGFVLWNIDNIFCPSLRELREGSGSYGVLKAGTQLHAWWHIFTGYATYLHILFSSHARTLYLKKSCSVQLLDELPMIYGMCIYVYSLKFYCRSKSRVPNVLYASLAFIYCAVSTYVYLRVNHPIFFQFFYGSLVIYSMFETVLLCKKEPSLRILATQALLLYGVAFVLWNIDNHWCSSLRSIRMASSHVVAVDAISQLHAWWHIISGHAAFLQFLLTVNARMLHLKKSFNVKSIAIWPYLDF